MSVDRAKGEACDNPAPNWRRTIALCGLVSALDGYDLLVVAVTIPVMAKQWGVQPAAFGVALAATSLAMALGASLVGSLGDRFGRRPLVIASFALASITMLAVPLVNNVGQLAALRFLTGLGLGASLANVLALGSECAPSPVRSRVVTGIYALSGIGGVLGGLVTPWLMDAGGWQMPYLFGGGVSLLVCLMLLAILPESPKFLAGRLDILNKVPALGPHRLIAGLLAGSLALATLFIWLLFFISSFSAYLISSWLPTLMHGSGWSIAHSSRAITAFSLGGVIAGLAMSWLSDRGHGRTALMTAYFASGLALVALSLAPPILALWFALIMLLGAATTGVMYLLPGIAARVYPPSLGATGIGAASAVGRVGSTLAPLAGSGLLLLGFNGVGLLLFLIVPMALGLMASLLFPRAVRAAQTSLQQSA